VRAGEGLIVCAAVPHQLCHKVESAKRLQLLHTTTITLHHTAPPCCLLCCLQVLQLRQQLAAPEGSPHRTLTAHTAAAAAAGDGGAAAAAGGGGGGVMSLSALQLLCVADEVAAREAHKWGARLTATEQVSWTAC